MNYLESILSMSFLREFELIIRKKIGTQILKISGVVITVSLITSISSLAQNEEKVDLSFDQVPLGDVLKSIGKEYKYNLSYSSNVIPINELITIDKSGITVEEAMSEILKDLPVSFNIFKDRITLKFNDLRQTIRGTVIDVDTQVPIFGATVSVLNTNPLLGAVTDMEGNFRIENVIVGRRSIKMNYLGYEEVVIPNILVGAGKEVVLKIEAEESIVKMDEVIISASGVKAAPVNEMAIVSGRSFTVEETKRFPISVGDPMRLASSFAGVTSTDDESNEIVIRGNTPRGILWKLEGVEIPNPNHFSSEGASSGAISMFSTQVISRSDFFTGAFAPEYGNATSGVFDIHLRNGNNEKREYTTQLGFLGLNVALEGPFKKEKKSSYLFNYRYSTLSVLAGLGIIPQENGETNIFQDLSFKMNFPTKSFGTFSVFGLGGLSKFKETVPNNFDDEEQYNMGIIGISNQYIINNSTFIRTTLSASGTDLIDDFQLASANEQSVISFKKSYKRVNFVLNKKFSARHLVETGFIYSALSFDFNESFKNPNNPVPFQDFERFNDKGSSASEQAYLSWKFKISDELSMVNGLHFLRFDLTGQTSYEPRASIKWQFADRQSLYAGYGLHSRIESLEYYLGNFINDDGSVTDHNRDLGLTKSRHYVLGYDSQIGSYAYFRAELYYQSLFDVPVLVDENGSAFSSLNFSQGYTPEPLINSGKGTNYGIEFTLERKFAEGFYYMLNTSLYESKYQSRDGVERDTRFNGNFSYNILAGKEYKVGINGKNNIFGISMKMAHAGNRRETPIDLALSRQFRREIRPGGDNAFSAQFPNYFRFDLQLSFRKNKKGRTSEWRLDIQNLTGRKNLAERFYNQSSQSIINAEQLGLIPLLSYRMEF